MMKQVNEIMLKAIATVIILGLAVLYGFVIVTYVQSTENDYASEVLAKPTSLICDIEDVDAASKFQDYYNTLPAYLQYCNYDNIIFTDNLTAHVEKAIGLSGCIVFNLKSNSYTVYVKNEGDVKDTLYHELAHVLDSPDHKTIKYSNSATWKKIQRMDGDTIAFEKYNIEAYYEMSDERQLVETFAMAFAWYYCNPNRLQELCPQMYEYMDNFTMRME